MFQSFTIAVVACALALTLQGCSVSSSSGVMKPGESKSGFMGMSKTAEVLVDNPKTLKEHPNKVIIGSFKVGFLIENKARATAKGGMFSASTGSGKASANVKLQGLSIAQMQQITDSLYQQLVKDLQDKGYTVVMPEELSTEPAYVELQNLGVASPEEGVVMNMALNGKATYVAPQGRNLIYYIGEKKAAFALSTATIQKSQALSETAGALVLSAHYLVNFVNADTHGGWKMTAGVKVGQGLAVVPGSHITVYNGKNKMPAVVKLGQPVFFDKEFCTVQKTTSGAAKAIGTVTNVASAILGGGTSQSESFDYNIDVDAYTTGAMEIGTKTNQKLVEKLASVK